MLFYRIRDRSFLFYISHEGMFLHSSVFKKLLAGFDDFFGVKWIFPPYPSIIAGQVIYVQLLVDLHFIDLLPLQRHFLRDKLFGELGSLFQSPLILAERAQ